MHDSNAPPAPKDCQSCPYTVTKQRKYGQTIHCTLEPTEMDITHVKGRSLFCPMRYSWR